MNNEGYQITYTGEEVQELLDKAGTAVQTETDPTVPSWAKAEEKPTYTATEVGALPEDTELFSGSYNDLTDKPTIPDSLSDLSDDSTHRLVTDAEKTAWNGKSDFSGSYDDLTDKPTIPDAQVQSDWTEADSTKVDYIKNKPSLATVATSGSYADLSNKPSIPSAQIQSDWSQSDNTALDYIKNKPSIPAAGLPTGGNAGQVLCKTDGSTDYAVGWTNQTQNYPSAYCTTSGSTAAKKANCSLYAAQANSYLHVLIGSNNISASALTLNVNSEGAKPIYINGTASSATNYTLPKGTYIVFYDGTNYYFRTDGKIQAPNGTLVQTNSTAGLLKNDGTIDTTSYGTYSKPSGGIPAADLASGVIPTVPTISTDISTDGSSDTKTASPKAVKTFVEGKGYTTNTGTITSIKMNGSTIASSGEANLGTVITDISGKQDVIDSSHKLSADLIEDGTTNKVINVKPNWNVATSGDYADLQNAPYYVICTQAEYNAMASHDADTYYIILSNA